MVDGAGSFSGPFFEEQFQTYGVVGILNIFIA
jgi:hypothetical protein